MRELELVIGHVADPAETCRHWAQLERARRNSQWLQSHWNDLLPQARGKFLAVAGQEAFIADTEEEAWSCAMKAHPEDDGALCQHVFSYAGPRIYGHRRRVAHV